MFVIEAGVPLPKQRRRYSAYPFAELAIGDSFIVPQDPDGSPPVRVFTQVYAWSRRDGRQFMARRVDGGIRVWRIR